MTIKINFQTYVKQHWGKLFSSMFMLILTLAVLGFLIYRQKDILLTFDWKIYWIFAFPAWIVHGLLLFIGALAFSGIMETLDKHLDFRKHFHMFCINMLARRIPGTLWYILYRNKAYEKNGYSSKVTTLASGVEMAVSLVSGLLISGLLGGTIFQQLKINIWPFALIFVLGLLLLQPKILRKLIKKLGSNPERFGYTQLLTWTGLYMLLWLIGGCLIYLIINLIFPLELRYIWFVIGSWTVVGTLTQLIFFLPTNFGITEISLSLLLSVIMPSPIAVIISILIRILLIISETSWTGISFLINK